MYHPKDIINLIADNVKKTKNPFGIPKFVINKWWKKAEVPRQGDALLFTGLMYQFVPYIEKSTTYLARYEDTKLAYFAKYGKYIPKLLSGLGLAAITPGKEKKEFNGILQDIAKILTKSGVDFFYDAKMDDYSGVLLYDLGDQEGFVQHAKYVAAKLKQNGIKKLITVDPHTTYALKILYPKYTGESFEVHTYFELLNLKSKNGHQRIVLHDPCFYGRYLELSDVPARILSSIDIECAPIRNSGLFTNCCGGPAESISPKLSEEVGDRRIQELKAGDAPIVAMCPICLGNLRKAGADVEDLSTLIARQTE
ncbi:MAG: (Fe-S)-binding protein [Deltaproteobacteria bacterium]|nr:(Fe-S)-binding protein [Deltaproteobacteria bacterium]